MKKIKTIYHGSALPIAKPELMTLNRRLDFGAGFYATSNFEQARRWALIKKRRLKADQAVVSSYRLTLNLDSCGLNVKLFDHADAAWLDFVMAHRTESGRSKNQYDIVCGPVANDTLYETLTLFERGILTHAETIVRLKTHKLADQLVFATPAALSLLVFDGEGAADE